MLLGRHCIGTVGILSGISNVPTAFLDSYTDMCRYNERHLLDETTDIRYIHSRATYRYEARNDIVRRAAGNWVLMLDTDQTFEPNILERLLRVAQKPGVDVVSGLYYQRFGRHLPNAYKWCSDAPDERFANHVIDFPRHQVFRIDAAGAGCLFVRRGVYARIVQECKAEPFTQFERMGEDFSFYARCRDLGIPVWLAPSIELGHITEESVGRWHHEQYRGGLARAQVEAEVPGGD